MAGKMGFQVHALSFSYGQRHSSELMAAGRIARNFGTAEHRIIQLDPVLFTGSSLTGTGSVPAGSEEPTSGDRIPSTYVPARNTVFLAMALAYAETIGSHDIFIGVNALDYSGYPDCRPEFIEAFRKLARLATKDAVEGNPVRVHAPLQHMTKAQIIKQGLELGVDYSLTQSCYSPDEEGRACGECDSCILRIRGFREAGVPDPTVYALNERVE
jgi:7-cyano-7-deazaguanine synthase